MFLLKFYVRYTFIPVCGCKGGEEKDGCGSRGADEGARWFRSSMR